MTGSSNKVSVRLDGSEWGLFIDKNAPLAFTFDGKLHMGYAGDVIASALYAGGQRLLSRSFKYHRPRGALTMSGHDANTIVQVADEPNVRADRYNLRDGISVASVNRLASLNFDMLAVMGAFKRFLPVGFYYKTFFRPKGIWPWFEKPIRHMAGLGYLEPAAKPRSYDKAYKFTDVLVVGGGAAGMEAALAAAESGAETLLIDEWPELGGSLLYGRGEFSRGLTDEVRRDLLARVQQAENLQVMTGTTVSGVFADNWVSALDANRLYKIRAKQIVLSTGAFEQPLVFPNNDRPGIMFASAAQRLMRLYGVCPANRAVIATSNRFGYEAALDLLDAGVAVAAVVDLRAKPEGGMAEDAVRARGVRVLTGAMPVNSKGRRGITSVAIARIADDGKTAGQAQWIDCDALLMAVGFAPQLNLACHAGARAVYDAETNMQRAEGVPDGITLAGSAAGHWDATDVRAGGAVAGKRAAARAKNESASGDEPLLSSGASASNISHPYPIFSAATGSNFVDFDEDLTVKDIVNTVKDGYDDIQLVKRYSTAGLGPSQGRHANVNTIRIVARQIGKPAAAIGTTTYRPPLVPEKFGMLAGRAFEPRRLTAMHHRHIELGAQMMSAGLWMRPRYYGAKSDAERSIAREVEAVRRGVGMIDVSTLGSLEVRGPDAGAFMDRVYTWAYEKQPLGRARYALMTDQTGVIIDDGVAARLGERHYYVTATTGAVDQVYRQMSWFNAQWRMDVDVANVTAAYAGINLAGPQARAVIETLASDIDFSAAAFPYMAVRTGTLAGISVRILRVGFVGELGYEIHCPSGQGEALWDNLMQAGKPFGIRPFGVEAQRILRLEKGHIIVGQDTDGLTHPAEANMEWALGKKKPFYIGKRAVDMQMAKGVARKLAGFALVDSTAPTPKECHLIIRDGDIAGRVTSVTRSPTLGKVIGLAYVPPELAQPGSRFEIRVDGGQMVMAETVATLFYDPENARQEL
ncbi:glycine cleavage T C-terminal barrel domain-containing protein [Hyphomicrobium sp. D-2]|uniref:glycine cleavage T C-terminal barrel domain-containing protein n=1 Tax=Hyphomicrobium sp. D-2 TaxID=3041621 RepID=UPI0024585DDB|nr:glycine cleavage T C-terminal barrel domain-containing protein [Hyphomicrobium sp. D-2]MDH4980737.1 glycine cleavage T C-terminal barrel domain-containing protein [Hyphomicrobium sp. D-2]